MADICFCIGSTKQGSFHLELKLSDGFESTVKAMHRTHSDWHWLCHFYWIALFLMQTWLIPLYERY